jgi:Ca-activated chloride channel family protein
MNTPIQNSDLIRRDDLTDRLIDTALAELIGGATPPDLSAQIAAATSRQPVTPASTAAITQPPRTRRNRAFWASLAVAAMLLVGVTFLLSPTLHSFRSKARDVAKSAHQIQSLNRLSRLSPEASPSPLETATKPKSDIAAMKPEFQSSHNTLHPAALTPPTPFEMPAKPVVETAKSTDFDSLADLVQSTVTTDSFKTEPKAANANGELVDHFDRVVDRAKALAQGASRPARFAGPEGVREPSGYYLTDDVQYQPPGREFSLDKSGPAPTPNTTRIAGGRAVAIMKERLNKKESVEGAAWSMRDATPEGVGPNSSGDRYTQIIENPFIKAAGGDAVSTFSIDVDTASYSNVRQFLMDMHRLPPPDAVRIEELINYFKYDYAGPPAAPGSAGGSKDDAPFAAHVEVASCPWNTEHRLARVAVKGREMDRNKRPPSNLVFLVDVSGSMNEPAKLPLVVYGLEQLTHELGENDHIAIVVYAGTEGLVLPSTSGSKQDTILAALHNLQAGGSTAGGAGIQLAYQIAEDNFIKGGTNRVILCTDGDFNVGVTNTADLQRMVEQKAKDTGVFLSTLGFGRGNLNDAMMVAISDHGNGNYHYIDNRTEARRVLVEQLTGTLVTIAKDVKIQVEFNPAKVAGYRLIGYEKRMLRTEDFNNDKKDAGEIGAGHTVTAFYEIVPADKKVDVAPIDELKYQKPVGRTILSVDKSTNDKGKDQKAETDKIVRPTDVSNELLTLKMRYKAPDGDTSKKLEWPITDDGKSFSAATTDMKFASAVAGFGMLLRNSEYKGNLTYAAVQELAQSGIGDDPHGYRKEFLEMVRTARELRHEAQ